MATVPATQKNTIQAYLSDPYVMKQIERAIPKHMTSDRLLRVCLTSIQTNPRLLECTPKSLLGCIMIAAQLGLEPSPVTGQAALVPFKNNRKNCYEAQFQIMYKGLLALVRRSGELQSVQAQVVYEQDAFTLQYGLDEKLEHTPADGERGKVKGAYVVFRYKDGGHSFDYMSRYDIDKIRKRSKAKDDGPWVTDYAEMAKKTVIKRHCKLAPVSIEMQTATALDDRIQIGESQMDLLGDADPIDVAVETEDDANPGEHESPSVFQRVLDEQSEAGNRGIFLRFVEDTATANECTVDDVKASVTDETKYAFLEQFRAWQKTPKSEPSPPEATPTQAEPETPAISHPEQSDAAPPGNGPTDQEKHDWETIRGLKTKGFTTWMDAFHDRIPAMSGWMKLNLGNKCRIIFNLALQEKLAGYTGPVVTPPDSSIECPISGGMMNPDYCQNHCNEREKCDAWKVE